MAATNPLIRILPLIFFLLPMSNGAAFQHARLDVCDEFKGMPPLHIPTPKSATSNYLAETEIGVSRVRKSRECSSWPRIDCQRRLRTFRIQTIYCHELTSFDTS